MQNAAQKRGKTCMQEVTVIIPNYNGKDLLKNCIKTLEEQTHQDFKLLIVDNGSTDGSTGLHSNILDMQMIALKENTGFCGAVNIGIRETKTPYFILLNNDTEAEPHFVEALVTAIGQSEHIFSCAAQMLDFKNRKILDNAGDYYTALGWAVARGKGKPAASFNRECCVFSCCGGAAIYRTDVVCETGLLDEAHFAYLEDVDLGYRARILGYENRYVPSAKVYHVGSATTGTRYNEKKVFLAARNTIYVLYKNMPLLQILLNLPLILPGILVKWLFFMRKRLGKQYMGGIREGIRTCTTLKKVKFRFQNFPHYAKIQLELWYNIFKILFSVLK